MSSFYLNIGLWHPGSKERLMVHRPLACLESAGFRIKRCAIVTPPDGEPTLVVQATFEDDYNTVFKIVHRTAEMIGQDCIALWKNDIEIAAVGHDPGVLIGPRAAEWGTFDLSKFHFL
jgi:hypothetical protein